MFTLFSAEKPSGTMKAQESEGGLMQDVRLCETLQDEDRIAEAYFLLQNIREYIRTGNADEATKDRLERYINESANLQRLELLGRDIADELKLMMDVDQWNLWNNNIGPHQDVSVYTHRLESKGVYHFKLEGEIRCPLKEVLPAILENSTYQYWVPMCGHSEMLQSPSTFRRITKTEVNFVLFQKTCVNDVRGDILSDGSAVLTIKPVLTSDSFANFLPRNANQRMNLWGSIYIKEEEKDEEKEDEEDVIAHGLLNRSKSGSDASFGQLYEEKSSTIWEDNKMKPRDLAAASADLDNIYSLKFIPSASHQKRRRKIKVVKVTATFKADMLSEIIQDWIFNLAVRSAISMFIPMLEHQAGLFKKEGIHYNLIEKRVAFYDQIEERIRDYQKRSISIN